MRGYASHLGFRSVTAFLLLGVLACSRPAVPNPQTAPVAEVPVLRLDSAIVRPTDAVFVIPVDARPEWRWHLPETRADLREYRWEFQILSAGRLYLFGYSLFRRADRQTGRGPLAALLRAGQRTLWYERPDSMWAVIPTRAIEAEARGEDRVIIRVQSAAAVAELFQDRPSHIRLLVLVPGTAERTYTVPLTYAAGAPRSS